MLQLKTIEPSTFDLLQRLQCSAVLSETRLVGGTALALQIGHRTSIDLDFFGKVIGDTDSVKNGLQDDNIQATFLNNQRSIHVFLIEGIKVDVVNYKYPWIDNPVIEDGIRLAGLKDIAAMKVAAITNRGTKKDFVDLFFLLQYFTLSEILDFYSAKFADGTLFIAQKSLTYFADAESDVMPRMMTPLKWGDVKKCILKEVNKL